MMHVSDPDHPITQIPLTVSTPPIASKELSFTAGLVEGYSFNDGGIRCFVPTMISADQLARFKKFVECIQLHEFACGEVKVKDQTKPKKKGTRQ